jgi:hypothetical protein
MNSDLIFLNLKDVRLRKEALSSLSNPVNSSSQEIQTNAGKQVALATALPG